MVFVPVPNTAIVEFRYNLMLQEVENTLAFEYPAGMSQAALDALTASMASWYYYYLRPIQTNRLQMREIFAKDQSEEDGITSTNVTHAGLLGQYTTGNDLPTNVTFCISFRTALAGRSYRGRNYICGMKSAMIENGNYIYPTYRNSWISAYNHLIISGTTPPAGWRWVIASRYHDGVRRETGVATPVTDVVVSNDTLDSQRNRLPGRGR